jgi:hypothetical protein
MSRAFGPKSAQTRALFVGTLTAGGGWIKAPPGWGGVPEPAEVGAG